MSNEAWMNADRKTREKLRNIVQKICRREKVPKGWKEGWICPIYKKGDKQKAENYRGITRIQGIRYLQRFCIFC